MRFGLADLFGRSLRARLVLLFSLVLVPPVLIAWGKAVYDYYDQRRSMEQLLLQRAKLIATERDDLIKGARGLLKTLAELFSERPLEGASCEQNLRNSLAPSPEYQLLVILDPAGRVSCSNRWSDIGTTMDDRDWFRAALEGAELYVSSPIYSRLTQSVMLMVSAPLRSRTGSVSGVIAVGIPWDRMTASPPRYEEKASGTLLALLDRDGRIFPFEQNGTQTVRPYAEEALMQAFANGPPERASEGWIVASPGTQWALAPFAGGTLFVALGQPQHIVNRQLNLPLIAGLALPTLIWVAAVATAWIAANRLIVRWVLRVREHAASIAAGRTIDPDERLNGAPRELQQLATSLRRMMATIRERNADLREALQHREMLIKEIHHRVKNNLQIIASLLNLQMRGIRDGAARDAMMTVRSRVNALALIHRTLYETDEMQQVELGGFLRALAEQVSDFLDASERHIDVRVAVPTVLVPAETAVTVALLVTEALTNAFKHAFPYRRDGHVTIRMEPSPNGTAILSIADDGVGGVRHSPDDQQDLSDRSLGNQLMLGYARQLGGVLAIDDSGGTIIRVELPAIPLTASPEEPASPVREAASD
jgi:two-component sensor histidine kinase